MTLRTKVLGLLLLAAVASGGAAAVRYMGAEWHRGGESCCHGQQDANFDPNADRPLVEPEGDDKRLSDEQGYCPVMTDTKLGEMGPPVKVFVKAGDGREEAVFVCCKGCKRKALADPDRTLAAVAELKASRR